jgi:fatty-acyl-CoA synthase
VVGRADGVMVEVGPHPEHGTFATITVAGTDDDQAIAKLRAALMPFQLRHEVKRA